MERAAELRPRPDPNTAGLARRAGAVFADRGTTRGHVLAETLNAARPVRQLFAISARLNAVTQAMFQEPDAQMGHGQPQPAPVHAPPIQAPPVQPPPGQGPLVHGPPAQDQAQQAPPQQQQAPEFALENLLYASSGPDAQEVGERSLYFGNGRRVRLIHDDGPHISEHPMERHTFRHNDATGRAYDEDDYDRLVDSGRPALEIQHGLNEMLKDAEIGDAGRLFEVAEGQLGIRNARTHPSRGRPTADTSIRSQVHLDQIVAIAREADGVLPRMDDEWHAARDRYDDLVDTCRNYEDDAADAERARDAAQGRRRRAEADLRHARSDRRLSRRAYERTVREIEGRIADAQRDFNRAYRDVGHFRRQLALTRNRRNDAEQHYRALRTAWEMRVAQFNQRIRVALQPPPAPAVNLEGVD